MTLQDDSEDTAQSRPAKPGDSTATGEATYVLNYNALMNTSLWCSALSHMSMTICIGFMWQAFGSRDAVGTAPVGRQQKLLPCGTEPGPAVSMVDLLLPKAEPINQ